MPPSDRPTVGFVVPIELTGATGKPERRWLAESGEVVESEKDAVRFTCFRSPTMRDRHRIDILVHELAGGLAAYLDLNDGAEKTRRAVVARLERQLWPSGRPKVEGDNYIEQEQALNAAWATDESNEKRGYEEMRGMLDRLLFIATWGVVVVDAPAGWESLADRELSIPIFYALWSAYIAALAPGAAGKAPPAGS